MPDSPDRSRMTKSAWSAPFALWVVRGWAAASKAHGWGKIADTVRSNILRQIEDAKHGKKS